MDEQLFDLFRQVSNAFQLKMRERMLGLDDFSLTELQGRLLSMIARRNGSSQRALVAKVGRDKAQVSRAIKDLENQGLVTRQTQESNWRADSLSITPDGERANAVIAREKARIIAETALALTEEDRESLRRILNKIIYCQEDTTTDADPPHQIQELNIQ